MNEHGPAGSVGSFYLQVQKLWGSGEDSIYFDAARSRYVGAVSLGYGGEGRRQRRKVTGKTDAEVRQKLKELHADLDIGVQSPAANTVQSAVDDWLADGLSGQSERTVVLYRDAVKPLTDALGAKQLRKLTAADVRSALAGLSGQLSTRSRPSARVLEQQRGMFTRLSGLGMGPGR